MTYDETLVIMSVLKTAYPAYYRGIKKADAEKTVALWASMFADDDAEVVAAAVKALIVTDEKGFPPHIGAVKAKIRQLVEPCAMTEMEAWRLVCNAVSVPTGSSVREQFDKLPRTIQRILGSPQTLFEWGTVDSDSFHTVIQSNFMRSYKARAASEREYNALPPDVKAIADSLAQNLALEPPKQITGDEWNSRRNELMAELSAAV